MAKLRAYELNGGDMLELVRYQKRDLQKAAGAEYDVLSSAQMIQSEKTDMENLGNIQSTLVIACRYKIKRS